MRRYLPILVLLFVGSGCAALIYEIVWFQLLQLIVGSSAISLGVLLGTYMGGMCLGSWLFADYVPASEHPLKVYAKIEAGIGLYAIVLLFAAPFVDNIYASVASHGLQGVFFRAVVAVILLLFPTLLMGASLPAVARWVESSREGVSWLGFFYGGNLAGAVFGCLFAGFYLLRVTDMRVATFVGAAINFGVAAIAWVLASRAEYVPQQSVGEAQPAEGSRAVYIAIALSGMTALGAEVIWTRLLSVMMGATTYTFSIILAVFLIGLGIGSAVGSSIAKSAHARAALGYCQLLLVLGIGWAAYTLAESLPYWPINPLLAPSAWFNFQVDMMRCVWTILPAACLWGASFPLALAAASSSSEDSGRLVGSVYAANTVGAIFGATGFSVILVPLMGSQDAQRVLMLLAAIAALILFTPAQRWIAVALTIVISVFAIRGVAKVPWLAMAYGRRMLTVSGTGMPLYEGEGMNSSIVVSQLDGGQIYFHVSGKTEASTETYDMRLQRMLGHLPALVHANPKSVLIVGFGAGVTAGTFVVHPEVQKITICELEKLIPPATSRYFNKENHDVYNDPRTTIHYDDARHFVLTSPEKYDIITSDPIHPWVKGTATLYSKEYYEMVKRHLNPGGVVTQWVPLYESDPETIKSELATFFEVFPNGTVWANNIGSEGYDVVLLGTAEPLHIDLDAVQKRLETQNELRRSMNEVGFTSPEQLFANYYGRASDLKSWYKGVTLNNDLNLRLQYMAGLGLNFNNADTIAKQIQAHLRFPDDIFAGSLDRLQNLRSSIQYR